MPRPSQWEIDNRYRAHVRALNQAKPTLSTKAARRYAASQKRKPSPGKSPPRRRPRAVEALPAMAAHHRTAPARRARPVATAGDSHIHLPQISEARPAGGCPTVHAANVD